MPGMDGLELKKRLDRDKIMVSFIAMSGNDYKKKEINSSSMKTPIN